jgi:hypothetical protein
MVENKKYGNESRGTRNQDYDGEGQQKFTRPTNYIPVQHNTDKCSYSRAVQSL